MDSLEKVQLDCSRKSTTESFLKHIIVNGSRKAGIVDALETTFQLLKTSI